LPAFFVPAARDQAEADQVYAAVRQFTVRQMGAVSDARVFSINYNHNGRQLRAEVGRPDPLSGEVVVAILRASHESGPFYICTANRGVVRGEPILAAGTWQTTVDYFT
jgi:hypothetical protein